MLVVEDDAAIRTMLLTVLEVTGYEARGVGNGLDAFAVLREWRPDVIVLDLYGPVMGGQEFLRRRMGLGDLAEIPVVVVTPSTAPLPSIRQLGVRAVLQRPHDVNQLRALVADAICGRSGGENSDAGSAHGPCLH